MARRVDQQRVAEWRERFERFRRSGLSVVRFCERERVSAPTFYLWRKRLARDIETGRSGSLAAGPFVPVRLVGTAALTAWLPGGTRLEIPLHDPQALELALQVLARLDDERRSGRMAPVTLVGGARC